MLALLVDERDILLRRLHAIEQYMAEFQLVRQRLPGAGSEHAVLRYSALSTH